MFSYSRQKGETGPRNRFCNMQTKYFTKSKKITFTNNLRVRRGKRPPLAGIRKPLAESGACQKTLNRKSTANFEEPNFTTVSGGPA
jgi:hypothetical protein